MFFLGCVLVAWDVANVVKNVYCSLSIREGAGSIDVLRNIFQKRGSKTSKKPGFASKEPPPSRPPEELMGLPAAGRW